MAKSVSQTGRYLDCQTSIHRLDDEIGLEKAAAEGDIVAVKLFLEKGTQHSPRDAFGSTPLIGYRNLLPTTSCFVITTYHNPISWSTPRL